MCDSCSLVLWSSYTVLYSPCVISVRILKQKNQWKYVCAMKIIICHNQSMFMFLSPISTSSGIALTKEAVNNLVTYT